MKRKISMFFICILATSISFAQSYKKEVRPTKNVILMIPDGCSIGVVSTARWYQIYNNLGGENLAIDPYLCGTVKTHSSNAPIGDSAPTTSAYMTGMPQQTGNVSIYPPADPENDLLYVDPAKAYQPLTTILEASKIEKKKATGLVVTAEFPHATPADCSSHHYKRSKYNQIGSQMVYQNMDVVFGGGTSIMTDDMINHLKNTGVDYITDDYKAFMSHNGNKLWALFGKTSMPYDIDRNANEIPSIAQMTQKAIEKLSTNENGFFLMVEGSQIDWAAHANDAFGMVTEYLAFDKAVQVAIDFAKKNGETTVIVLPDHGNSGFTMGRRSLPVGYDKMTIDQFLKDFSKFKRTASGMETILNETSIENIKPVFKEYTGIELTDEEVNNLKRGKGHEVDNYMEVSKSLNLRSEIIKIMNSRTYWGFTSGGHTGEEVFLAAYHPKGDVPMGMNTNIDIFKYLYSVSGLQTPIDKMTEKIFAKHTDVFKGQGIIINIDKKDPEFPVLVVKKGKKTLEIPAYKSIAYLNKSQFDLGSVTVYVDKNDTFYLPADLADKLN